MTPRRAIVAIIFSLSILGVMPARAADASLRVYLFGAASCDYCRQALEFLTREASADHSFTLNAYDVERDGSEAELFLRVLTDLGMDDPVIPIVIVGPQVLVGYSDDLTSGRRILAAIARCRTEPCADFVAPLARPGNVASRAGTWKVSRN